MGVAPGRLSPTAANAIEDGANEVFVSVVSAWEIEIKRAKGKLPIAVPLPDALAEQRFRTLPVTLPTFSRSNPCRNATAIRSTAC